MGEGGGGGGGAGGGGGGENNVLPRMYPSHTGQNLKEPDSSIIFKKKYHRSTAYTLLRCSSHCKARVCWGEKAFLRNDESRSS